MLDLYLIIGLMLVASIVVAMTSAKIYPKLKRRGRFLFGLAILAPLPVAIYVGTPLPLLVKLFPISGLIAMSSPVPLLAGALAGIAWSGIPGGTLRKALTIVPLTGAALFTTYLPLFSPTPACGDTWIEGLCMQTTRSTCSAASIATLLRHYEISATESEIATLCRTTKHGSLPAGCYRALKLMTADTPHRVVVKSLTLDELRKCPTPALITVGLPRVHSLDPRYETHWGWIPGVKHSVLFYGFLSENTVAIGDPSVGREKWNVTGILDLWQGEVMRLHTPVQAIQP